MSDYPYETKRKIEALIKSLEQAAQRDPEQEVQGMALPMLDAVIEEVRRVRPNDVVVEAARGIISADHIASGDPVRAVDALLVAHQLDAAIGPLPPTETYFGSRDSGF